MKMFKYINYNIFIYFSFILEWQNFVLWHWHLPHCFTDPAINKTKPTVEIKNATKKELCKKKITLVCLAKDFYPDHVKVAWFVGKQEITEDVATDPHATFVNKKYTISSRLKVSQKMWKKPTNIFTCTVSYFNGNFTTDHSASVHGVAGMSYTMMHIVYTMMHILCI